MYFGSGYVYEYSNLEHEHLSEEEYEDGLQISDEEDDNLEPLGALGASSHALPAVPPVPPVPPAPPLPSRMADQHAHSGGVKGFFKSMFGGKEARNSASKPNLQRKANWKRLHASEPGHFDTHSKGRKERRADTNIISIDFKQLVSPSNMHTGDPIYCEGCQAVLSSISNLVPNNDMKLWMCEFCDHENKLDIEDEEKPKKNDTTFMLNSAPSTKSIGPSGTDNSLVVFCIDISGSMCLTTEVPGKLKLRGGSARLQRLNSDRSDQYLPGQSRNVTHVSRLQAVQAAVDHQLLTMVKEYPNRRVALIVFNNEVVVIGDGKGTPVTVAGDKLCNLEELQKIGSELTTPEEIKSTKQTLTENIYSLEEGGATALGPALLIATEMAMQQRGSKVIMCTDGMANIGLGRLDQNSEEEQAKAVQFYEQLAERAVDKGVAVSVISIKKTDCKLIHLGNVANKTGGQVNMVDPLKMTEEFSNVLEDSIIATQVVATCILHHNLFFFNEDGEESKVVKNIGNVTAGTEITFEYGIRIKKEGNKVVDKDVKPTENQGFDSAAGGEIKETGSESMKDPESQKINETGSKEEEVSGSYDMGATGSTKTDAKLDHGSDDTKGTAGAGGGNDEGASGGCREGSGESSKAGGSDDGRGLTEIPFQLQVKYTDTEGAVALRVLTQNKPVTRSREKAEEALNMEVLGKHAVQSSAALALQGDYTKARVKGMMNHRLAWRNIKTSKESNNKNKEVYLNAFKNLGKMDRRLSRQQTEEVRSRGCTYSDDEMEEEFAANSKTKKKLKRSKGTSDKSAKNLYQLMSRPSNAVTNYSESDSD